MTAVIPAAEQGAVGPLGRWWLKQLAPKPHTFEKPVVAKLAVQRHEGRVWF